MAAIADADLVERIAQMAREMGREIATPSETRNILGLVQR